MSSLLSASAVNPFVAEASSKWALQTLRAEIAWDAFLVTLVVSSILILQQARAHLKTKETHVEMQEETSPAAAPEPLRNYMQVEKQSAARVVSPEEESFFSKVRCLLASGKFSEVVAAFEQAGQQLSEFSHSQSSLTQALKALTSSGQQASLAWQLYSVTKDHVTFSRIMYHTLVAGLAREGEMDRANCVMRDMTLENVMPDLATYSAVVHGSLSRGDLDRALQMLSQIQRRGIKPDLPLLQSLLDACAQSQMTALTERVLRDMIAAGVAPTHATLASLVRLYCRTGDLAAALHAFETLPAKHGFQVNKQVYSDLIAACVTDGDASQAFAVYSKMTTAGHPVDATIYKALLTGSLQDGDLDSAARLLDDALCDGSAGLLARESVELFLLQAVRRGRGSELAAPVLQQAQRSGIFISERIANSVRRACEGGIP
eukprot:TRINITY_DN73968_c0_g1_i1.p1 TRINITY_DN73968_c0_g1~~TRINITY_DN73968_c0_g1_i1.p1  ORF type:complete len:432 (+),score=86.70 TRINITY_DN73968_c0_g1_i1:125-1420(+)